MSNITRRAIMGATAAVAVSTAFPVAANAVGAADDPIFAAIEAHRAAQALVDAHIAEHRGKSLAKIEAAGLEEEFNGLCSDVADEAWEMLEVEPTTVAGVGALLSYVAAYKQRNLEWLDRAGPNGEYCAIDFEDDAIAWAASSLERLAGERVS